jgi:uncharacterized protein (DUF486 family)
VSPQFQTILLLAGANLIMNVAWYGHLKYPHMPLLMAILVAWGIAFFEYSLQVPANRIGHQVFSTPQLKGIQETLSIVTFFVVSTFLLGEPVTMKQLLGFGLMIVAAVLIVSK